MSHPSRSGYSLRGGDGYIESFNSKIREQFLNGELLCLLNEAQILMERGRIHSHYLPTQQSQRPATLARNHPTCELMANNDRWYKKFRVVRPCQQPEN